MFEFEQKFIYKLCVLIIMKYDIVTKDKDEYGCKIWFSVPTKKDVMDAIEKYDIDEIWKVTNNGKTEKDVTGIMFAEYILAHAKDYE